MGAGARGNAKGDVHNAQGDMDLSKKKWRSRTLKCLSETCRGQSEILC